MAYTTPTFDQTRAFLLAFFKSLLPDRDASPLKLFGKLITWVSGAVTDLHAHVDSAQRDVMPDTAEEAALERWASIKAVGRKSATPARKANALRVTGTLGATVAIGDQLTDPTTGLRYQVGEAGTIPAALYLDVDLVAVDTGSQTRIPAGTTLEFVAPPAGIATEAELVLDLDEDGEDQEQDGALRGRLLAAFGDEPLGGSPADFVRWSLQLTGIAAAYCYPNRAGLGSVDVAALHTGSGSARLLNAGERDELLAHLRSLAPGHLAQPGGDLRVLEVVAETVNVEVTVEAFADADYEFDWDDATPPVVAGWNGVTRTLSFTLARPATMKAGDRITIKPAAGGGTGEQYRIEALGGVATDVILETVPTPAPAATDVVYSGGPLVDPIRSAILAHLNGEVVYAGDGVPQPASTAGSTVRLRVLAEPIGTANPAAAYGSWSGALIRATVAKLATYTAGVRNCSVTAPVSDVEAADYAIPNDGQIGLLVPGRVLVRSA